MRQVLEIQRGSDVVCMGTIKDSAGVAINLTGYTLMAFEPSTELAPHLTLAIVDALADGCGGPG